MGHTGGFVPQELLCGGFEFCNNTWHHQGLDYKMPAQICFDATQKRESAVRAEGNLNLT